MDISDRSTRSDHNSIKNKTDDYITHLETQLVSHQIQRSQGRDYKRILRGYNKPGQWYKLSATPRTVYYYYDTQLQKYLEHQSKLPNNNNNNNNTQTIPPPIRIPIQSKLRTKCHHNSPNFSFHPQQQQKHSQKLPSRLQSVPTLPPIVAHKKPNHE